MRINKQTYQLVELDGLTDRLKEHPKNPKRGNLGAIHESVNVNGWFGAVLAQESTGYILAGNHKFRTAMAQGAKEVPVLWLDVDDDAALRILLADNQIAALGQMDEAALDAILGELDDLAGTGYGDTLFEAEKAVEEASASNGGVEAEVPDDEFESQYGVVVLCGDAQHQERVYVALAGASEGGDVSEDGLAALASTTIKVVAI